jgi:two-component system, LytTR family, response regulator
MKIRALIVDDEPLARQRIRHLARDEAALEVVGECASAVEALAEIQRQGPDLLFLDVQMPEMNGFELLQKLPRERLPLVIFTTAYDQHAVRAFEAHALDYLLKPFEPDRFKAAVARAHEHLANQQASVAARGLLDLLATGQNSLSAPNSKAYLTRLTVKSNDKVVVIKSTDIDSIESAGNYVAVNVGRESHILRETLNALETQLDPENFLRVSRSAIVNLDRVRELQPMFRGEHIIVLQNGKRILMTRGLLREVEQALRFR